MGREVTIKYVRRRGKNGKSLSAKLMQLWWQAGVGHSQRPSHSLSVSAANNTAKSPESKPTGQNLPVSSNSIAEW